MQPTCPVCQSTYVRRSPRAGVFENLLSLLYVYPFRCQLCSYRFTALQWGIRYAKHQDLRQYERIGVRFPVLFGNGQIVGKGTVTDVSVGDCAIETAVQLHQGDALKLELFAKSGRPPIVVTRAVVRSVRQGQVGVQFVDMEDSEKARLNRLVADMVGAFIAPLQEPAEPASRVTEEAPR
jgi:hypothetical protein